MGSLLVALTIFFNLMQQGFIVGSGFWLSVWASDATRTLKDRSEKEYFYLGVYALLGFLQGIFRMHERTIMWWCDHRHCSNVRFYFAFRSGEYFRANYYHVPGYIKRVEVNSQLLAKGSTSLARSHIR